jgi:hypothetical protein
LQAEHHEKKENLINALEGIDRSKWKEERDMYSDVIKAIQDGLYDGEKDNRVVDTHAKGESADISVAQYSDSRLPYTLQYFIELKFQTTKLDNAENCGQVVDYFNGVREKQPTRMEFVAILSNFEESFVFKARYDHNKVSIVKQAAMGFADAVICADRSSRYHYHDRIPELDSHRWHGSQYEILNISSRHFLLSALKPKPSLNSTETGSRGNPHFTRSKVGSSSRGNPWRDNWWQDPSQHSLDNGRFVLKIGKGTNSVANEIALLKLLRSSPHSSDCPNLPEIVWFPDGNQELGILPVGKPIDFNETAAASRKIVHGLMDGLKFLHNLGIVHRDIRPSNLILDYTKGFNAVIVDFENALSIEGGAKGVEYFGGFISWPRQHLNSNRKLYIPKVEDDLHASILLVLHLLFPQQFNSFPSGRVGVATTPDTRSLETNKLLELWDNIENSCMWKPFLKAASEKDYGKLKGMADVFCRF